MKCIICNSPNIKEKKVDEEIRLKNDVILLSLKTLVCLECGERYYDRKTMKLIEETKDNIRKQKTKLQPIGQVLKTVSI
ncbi:MAG: hypothetical protein A2252_01850 [Elusimicrobia bacterium RIFOXYA2_FULL_39_19]|nr:MAG: hypothetical protein A2252_01850 [Elusimicrobia bacterium RIFOXYA2_FULL_39_19]